MKSAASLTPRLMYKGTLSLCRVLDLTRPALPFLSNLEQKVTFDDEPDEYGGIGYKRVKICTKELKL